MVIVEGQFQVDDIERARPLMAVMIEASRAEEGCLDYAYGEDVLQPGVIRVIERWRDREALDAHFDSVHLKRWRASWSGAGIHSRQLRIFETGFEPA